MGILSALFSPKKIGEVATSAVRGLDDLILTDQERIEKTQQAQDLYSKLWLAATPSAIARRIIAVITVSVWAVLVLFSVLIHGVSPEWSKQSQHVLETVVMAPVNIILGFYFISQIVTNYQKKA